MHTTTERSKSRREAPKVKRQRRQPQPVQIEADAYYRAEQLAARWGVHVMSVWQWSRDDKIPRPRKIGPNVSRWLGADIIAHEQSAQQ